MKSKLLFILCFMGLLCSCEHRAAGQPAKRGTTSSTSAKSQSSVSKKTSSQNSDRKKMTGAQIFKKYNSAVFMVYTINTDGVSRSQGSGFFISGKGLALSNYHVFEDAVEGLEQIKVGDSFYKVSEVVKIDETNDIIIFRVDGHGEKFNYVPVAHKKPTVGSKAYAIGSPRGLENTLSSGEVSQLRNNNHLIQINVPIDHGSSGGCLLNEYGEAIGITSSGYDDSGANLNFAVNIQIVRSYIKIP